MNAEALTFTQFLDFFSSWYPYLVPSALAVTFGLGCILDWIRVFYLRWRGDYENHVEQWWLPLLKKLLIEDIIYGRSWGSSTSYYWVKNKNRYCEWAAFTSKEKAEDYLKDQTSVRPNKTASTMSSEFDRQSLIGLKILLGIAKLFFGLVMIKILPWSISIGLAVGVSLMLLDRAIVRLVKKVKEHISNPNAHKQNEEK